MLPYTKAVRPRGGGQAQRGALEAGGERGEGGDRLLEEGDGESGGQAAQLY